MELEYKEIQSVAAENKSVIGRPAEFALVDADGTTAFLEKALKFIEDYGKYFFLVLIIQHTSLLGISCSYEFVA
jgi:hypothetical protein